MTIVSWHLEKASEHINADEHGLALPPEIASSAYFMIVSSSD